jgi:hypothetical protein
MKHVGRAIRGAAQLAPLPGEALLIGVRRGGLAFASCPNLCQLVLVFAFQCLRWIKALLDSFHGAAPNLAFGNLCGDEQFEFREGVAAPGAIRKLT